MWMESDNCVYGRSNNPYDPSRIVGGSSGGEGAIVGAGASPFGLGADIGGSIRMPAFFNGVFGHKPTGTLVPGSGQFPIAHGSGLRMMTTGPICRRAVDLMPLLRTLAGPDAGDPECRAFTLGDPSQVKLRGLRVVSIEHNGFMRVSDELLRAQRRAADHLRSLGAHVVNASVKSLRASLPIWSAMMAAAGGPTYGELLGNGEPVKVGRELARWLVRRSPYTIMSLMLATVEKLPLIRGRTGDQLLALGRALRGELVDLIGDGVMLYPSFPKVAPKHGEPLFPPVQWTYTAILNALELPSTQVPLGLNDEQLPLGVQVVTTHGHDHRSIAVALELERAFGGWTPPSWCENDRWSRASCRPGQPPVMTTLPAPL
jgi:fatty acid amide hydrolase 2